MNLLLDDSDDEFEAEEDDEDDDEEEAAEEATDTSSHLSDSSDNNPEAGTSDTPDRSEEDSDPDGAPRDTRSEEGTSELWESAQRTEVTDSDQISDISDGPVEGTNEAVQSGLEGTNEAVQSRSAAELETALPRTDDNQPSSNTPANGPIPRKVDPLDTTREVLSVSVSMTRPRLPLDGVDPEPDPEVREPSYRPSLHCMRELLSFAENQSRAQQEEARRVLKYLLSMEDPRCRHQGTDLEQGRRGSDAERRRPTGRAQDQRQTGHSGGAERRRPARRAQTGRDETGCRRSSPDRETRGVSRREDRDEIRIRSDPRDDRPLDGAPKTEDSRENGSTDSESQRIQARTARKAEQEQSSRPSNRPEADGASRDGHHGFSGSLFQASTQPANQGRRTDAERATGARPKAGRAKNGHAQLPRRADGRSELRPGSGSRGRPRARQTDFRHASCGHCGPSAPTAHARPRRRKQGARRRELHPGDDPLSPNAPTPSATEAGSNRNRPNRHDGAPGRGRGNRGRRRQRTRFHEFQAPPSSPKPWSQGAQVRFDRMMNNWMAEHRPGERDEGVESSNSWYETQDENTDDEERVRRAQGSCHNNVHLTGLMTNTETGKSTKLKMVVDQGQTIKQGILISEELMKELGLSFEKLLHGKKVGTAKGGATLDKVGITKPFTLKIPGISRTFKSRATVCKDVADHCNLGTAFLQSIHRATGLTPRLEFSKGGTRLTLGTDEVELVKRAADQPEGKGLGPDGPAPGDRGRRAPRRTVPVDRRRSTSVGARRRGALPVFVEKDTVVKGNSLHLVQVDRIPASALLEPVKIPGLGGVSAVPGLYRDQKKIAVLNLKGEQVLRAGTQIAEITPARHVLKKAPEEKVRSAKEEEDRVEEVIKELRLDEKELLNEDPEMKRKVKELVREYIDIFSSPELAFGKTDLVEFEIDLEPGSKPYKTKVRPINPKQRQDLKEQLKRWQDEDVVEECESPWASALVPVLKKDGSTRWAVDYRPLNRMTIKDSYPLPSISENLEKLQGSRVFSTLDAAGVYHVVPVAEKARPLLAFITPFGLYTWKRMPFGASNSAPCFSRFMDMLVNKLRSPWVLGYLDDLLAHTITMEQHLEELKKIFLMHREAGIKLKAKKTDLFEKEVHYLGYKVTQEGVCMREDYVEKIVNWPTPKSVKQLSSFLGVVGYYRSFIPKFASLTHEMNAQKKKKELEWSDDLQAKFEHLKQLFKEKPIRAYPQYDGECFEVWPDFSALALGGVLQQVQGGQRRFIAASGRKTTAGEKNYPPTKGELASIIHILRKHEHLLRFKKFKIYTDHQPLKWLRTMKNPKGIYWRWLQELESYDYEIIHVAGKKTGAADGLSRSSHLPEPTPEEVAEADEYVYRTLDQGGHHSKLDRVALKEAQEQDEVLRIVKQWVKGDPPKTKEEIKGLHHDALVYHQHLAVLDVDEGDLLVMKKSPGFKEVQRILVPNQAKLRDEIFRFSHMHPSAGHFGAQATAARAGLKFYWPGMASELKQQVKKCDTCLGKIQQVNLKGGQHKPRKHGFPGEVLYMDLVGPMPETPDGMKYIVTLQDGFSRYASATTIPNKEACTVANALLETWITKFGCPVRIHTDQGREFHNSIWHQLCDRLQINKTTTPSYNPQSNLVERYHRTLNSIMRTHLAREDAGWSRFLPMATFAYNTKVNATTGLTPFEAFIGRPARLPIDLVVPTPDRQYPDADGYIQETLIRFEEMYRFMRKHTEATFKRNARLYAGNTNTFKMDDLVWIYSKRKVPGKPTKITDGWTGPYRVVGRPAEVLLDVTPAGTEGATTTVHVARAAKVRCENPERRNLLTQEAVEENDADELAEDLCLPARYFEPHDALLTAVPVKTGPEPPVIRDLPNMRRTPIKATLAPETPDVGAGPSGAQSAGNALAGHSKKRAPTSALSDDEPDDGKQGRFQGEKRGPAESEDPDDGKQGRYQGEKRYSGKPSKTEPPRFRRKRQAEKRDRQPDSDSQSGHTKHTKLGWRDLARDSGSESPLSDREMRMPTPELPEETDSSDEDIKAVTEAMEDLGDYVTIDIPPKVKPPVRATAGATGWDCRANQAVTIGPRQTRKVDIGLKMALPAGMCALLLSRSRLASEGLTVEGGLIDSDYRGPISCILHNNTECSRRIQKGERICQLLIISTPPIKWQTVQTLDGTERGNGGFGHTGQL